jgi:putative oxidoreductase
MIPSGVPSILPTMTDRLLAWLSDPGRGGWAPVVLRVLLAAVFIPAGLGKFVNHDVYVERFDRWGFGFAPGAVAILVGIVEVTGGLALLLGVLPRLACLVLAGNMVGALATAGRVDGGQDIWLPIVLIVLLSVLAGLGAGRLALAPSLPGAWRGGRRGA